MNHQNVTYKSDGSIFYGTKEARCQRRKADAKADKEEKKALKKRSKMNKKNTQCSWVFLVIFLLITGGILVKKWLLHL
jgi:hypothetical protein